MFANLSSTTDKVQLVTTTIGAFSLDVHASYVDITLADGTQTPGRQNTNITSATTTDVVSSPSAGIVRNIKYLSAVNSGTTGGTVAAYYNAAGTTYALSPTAIPIATAELVVFREGTPYHTDSNLGVYGAGQTFAAQADMETPTSTALVVSPKMVGYHPGVAKGVAFVTGGASPVINTPPTFNITITNTGTGRLTLTFTTAFSSSTSYVVLTMVEIVSTTLTASTNCMQSYMRFGGQTSASTCEIDCCDRAATTNVVRNPSAYHIVAFGDQ